jgi:hypothetical protein
MRRVSNAAGTQPLRHRAEPLDQRVGELVAGDLALAQALAVEVGGVQAALERREPRVRDRSATGASPRWTSICTAALMSPDGFAMPRPAMSGAEPCTASNMA